MTLNIQTGTGKQCRPRSPSDQSLHCLPVYHPIYIFWMHFFMVKPQCSNFKIITAFFPGVIFPPGFYNSNFPTPHKGSKLGLYVCQQKLVHLSSENSITCTLIFNIFYFVFLRWSQWMPTTLCFYEELKKITVMILSFWTDMPGQTVQTQIRLLLEEQKVQGLHCLPFRLHRLDSLLYGRAT